MKSAIANDDRYERLADLFDPMCDEAKASWDLIYQKNDGKQSELNYDADEAPWDLNEV
jgi:hypothetical protein